MIHALESGTAEHLLTWIEEITEKNLVTINMLGCHDGIPILDLKGKQINSTVRPGLLGDKEINRTNLTLEAVEKALQKPLVKNQLALLRLRNNHPAFRGRLEIGNSSEQHLLNLAWRNAKSSATLQANLQTLQFQIIHTSP